MFRLAAETLHKSDKGMFLDRPKRVFAIWAMCHLVIWTLVPWLCNECLPLDCMEAVMWGSQWQWGYDKHPPLSAWTAELAALIMGDAGIYLLSQLCIVTAAIAVYKLARFFALSSKQAVLAILLLDTIYFYQYISVEYNVNYLQMPCWAWGWYFGLRGLRDQKWLYWLGLGACVAAGALTKYLAVFMLIPLFACWWQRGELGKALKSPGLYLAGLVSILLFLPHFFWMMDNEWMTISYGLSRGDSEVSPWWHHLWMPVYFLGAQLAFLIPIGILGLSVWRKEKSFGYPPAGSFALAFGAYIFLALFCLLMAFKPVTMWAAPMPLAIGIWAVTKFKLDQFPQWVLRASVIMFSLFVVAYVVVFGFGPQIRKTPHRVNYPAREIASQVESIWHEKYQTELEYVVADEWLGGIMNRYGQDRAEVMIRGWLDHSRYLTDEEVREKGAVILWLESRDASSGRSRPMEETFGDLKSRYPGIYQLDDLVIEWPRRSDGNAGRYGIAIIPPAN